MNMKIDLSPTLYSHKDAEKNALELNESETERWSYHVVGIRGYNCLIIVKDDHGTFVGYF